VCVYIYIYLCTYAYIMFMYVDMYVCTMYLTYVCMYACMYICMYSCTYVPIYVSKHLCVYVPTYVCKHLCVYVPTYVCKHLCVYVPTYVCKHLCVYVPTMFLDIGTRRGDWSASHPGRFLHSGKTRYPLYRRLGGPRGRSGSLQKISPPPGFFFFCRILLVSCTLLVWNCSGIRRKTERLRAVDFAIMKNPTASVGSEPAILGSRGQHANP
jgi:hypothetical protein